MANKKRQRQQIEEKANTSKKSQLIKRYYFLFLSLFCNFLLFFSYGKRYIYSKSILNLCPLLGYIILVSSLPFKEEKIKRREKSLITERKMSKSFTTIIKIIIIVNIFIFVSNEKLLFNLSMITLKIIGTGNKNIFGSDEKYYFKPENYPDKIIINEKDEDKVNLTYNFNQENNNIVLIWDNEISDCKWMFYRCSDIVDINLSNFNASKVKNMGGMFQNCKKLTSIILSNFDTSQVKEMWCMFYGCSSLTSIDLSYLNTSLVTMMGKMFYGCSKLSSLDLSNFNTSLVTTMGNMFYGCSELTSLDLSNFDTSKVTEMSNMFSGCSKLEYINLQNFKEIKLDACDNIFEQVPDNIIICINNDIISNNNSKILSQILNKTCYNIYCSEDWKAKKKEIIAYPIDGCQCKLDNCLSCPSFDYTNKRLCIRCDNNYYPIENESLNIEGYTNCYKEPIIGYYLDNNIFKKCFYFCESCEIGGNNNAHNCINCLSEYKFEINIDNYKNCYNNSIMESTIANINEVSTIIENINTIIEKQSNTPSIIEEDKENNENCTKNKINIYEFNHKCYENVLIIL